ncbi:DUF4332 domain-containing protein [Crateriforma spongiae]|uniref:DUF4332 domain-containing protein n=1 Tax=Crateriforma spongiae TaxID=2724528 RepID=UPI0014472774|nr:DUF4332 domain-containing protein [Crateriforma spongiae]
MLLDRIDIDTHGPLQRVEIGPLSEHLNVLLAPAGAGKTAIARFVRDSLVDRDYPLGMMSSSTGRVVWADRNGMVHCRREQDGSPHGRRTIEFETRGEYPIRFDNLEGSWVRTTAHNTDARLSLRSVELPESIVDGVITDTHLSDVSRVVSACVRSGLDHPETYRDLPLHGDSALASRGESGFRGYAYHELGSADPLGGNYRHDRESERQRRLRTELADVDAQIAELRPSDRTWQYDSLVRRREELHQRLAVLERRRIVPDADPVHRDASSSVLAQDYWHAADRSQWRNRLAKLHDRAESLRHRQAELRRWITAIDRDAHLYRPDRRFDGWAAGLDSRLRARINDVDAQIVHLRRTLVEVQSLRTLVADLAKRNDAWSTYRNRPSVDHFAAALDRYDRDAGWEDFYRRAYRPLHSIDDVQSRIAAATRQIDWLLNHYDAGPGLWSDWYAGAPVYRPVASDRPYSATSIAETLRAIRADLTDAWRYPTGTDYPNTDYRGSVETLRPVHDRSMAELESCFNWLTAAVDRLSAQRESLLRESAHLAETSRTAEFDSVYFRHPNWNHERGLRSEELQRVTSELETCLREAADLRASLRHLPVVDLHGMGATVTGPHRDEWKNQRDCFEYEQIVSELKQIDHQLSNGSRWDWLQRRRQQILQELGSIVRSTPSQTPLADAASRWLVRLSGGRLRHVSWNPAAHRHLADRRSHHDTARVGHESASLNVQIDGRPENQFGEADRGLASLAIRMAAADLLARTGRPVPLVIETWPSMFALAGGTQPVSATEAHRGYHEYGDDGRWNHSVTSALFDFVRTGRQLLVLTSDAEFANQANRTGARQFRLHGQATLHPHRPMWKPQYAPETYVGPHPHTTSVDRAAVGHATNAPVDQINRDFDVAWREAYGQHDLYLHREGQSRAMPATDLAADGTTYRDGFYYGNTYTTVQPTPGESDAKATAADQQLADADGSRMIRRRSAGEDQTDSPFFLTVDSPIDQAPSIDAVAAARLRSLGITHINHLMQQDSNRLSDSLGLGNTNAATIRRWQHECRLVCRVPQLRGFDARVLVGCGITDPAQLAAIHPDQLLVRVQAFLATERGQRILLSGSSYELSRITSWIASAHRSTSLDADGLVVDGKPVSSRSYREIERDPFDSERYEDARYDDDDYEYDRDADGRLIRRRRRRVLRHESDAVDYDNLRRNGRRRESSRSSSTSRSSGSSRSASSQRSTSSRSSSRRSSSTRSSNSGTRSYRNGERERTRRSHRQSDRDVVRISDGGDHDNTRRTYESEYDRDGYGRNGDGKSNGSGSGEASSQRGSSSRSSSSNSSSSRSSTSSNSSSRESSSSSEKTLRFYLQRSDDVVDAPSIGPRMAERLNAIGIYTVDDLLISDPAKVAEQLDHRRVEAETVLAWQQQATFVCRVPMLRGHDAQLLVLAEITSPEDLVAWDPSELLAIVDPIARGGEGQRILRGGALPDLEEVTGWVEYARQNRELKAA